MVKYATKAMEEEKITFVEHLEELRSRIIKSVILIIVVSGVMYTLAGKILSYLVKPVGGVLVFIGPAEAFVTNIKIALFGGLFLSSPFILFQIWQFISQGLKKSERKYVLIFGPVSFMFFTLGIGFGYFVIVPIGLRFLLGFATDFLVPMITIGKYISFIGTMTLAFGIVFQLPLAMLFLVKIGIVTPTFLSQKRRHAIVIIFIVGALLTPPDVITQCLMAGPLILLYELGILFSKLARK